MTAMTVQRDIIIPQRATFRKSFRFLRQNEAGEWVPNFTAQDVFVSQMWDDRRETLLAEFQVTADASEGLVQLYLPHSVTRTMRRNGRYEILSLLEEGDRRFRVKGNAFIDFNGTDAEDTP